MNITIHAQQVHLNGPHSSSLLDLLAFAGSPPSFTRTAEPMDRGAAAATAPSTTLVPGQFYAHEGGLYVGFMPARGALGAYHLFISEAQAELAYGPEVKTDGAGDHWDGAANTRALLASGHKHPAAEWCAQHAAHGKSDWYLPSHAELAMAWICCADVFTKEGYYWSSTQNARSYAFVQDFEFGLSGSGGKDSQRKVRAVRRSFI